MFRRASAILAAVALWTGLLPAGASAVGLKSCKQCSFPATRLDLRLQAEGFVPQYSWDVEVRPQEPLDLGPYRLLRGASLIGRVQVDGPAGGPSSEVELRPARMSPPPSREAAGRDEQRSLRTRVNARGFFQLTGVPAGEYRAVARLAGYAPGPSLPLTVQAGAEAELREPLVLHRPLALEVRLHPPLDPYGQPWQLLLLAADSAEKRRREAQALTDDKGEIELRGLVPGLVRLHARSEDRSSDWLTRTLAEGREEPPVQRFFPDLSVAPNALLGRAVSEADGRFQLQLDRSSTAGSLAVFAPGFAVKLLPAPAGWQAGGELPIAVSQAGGNVVVDLDGLGRRALARVLLVHAGAHLPLAHFLREGHGSPRRRGPATSSARSPRGIPRTPPA